MTTVVRAVRSAANRKVLALQRGYLDENSAARRDLALLRRNPAVGPVDPGVWAVLFEGLDDERLVGRLDEPNTAERALQATLTLYALHQQGRTGPVHSTDGASVGAAVRSLHQQTGAASTIDRLKAAGAATTFAGTCHHLRGLVSQFRSADRPIVVDYAALAGDLYQLQWPSSASQVRRRWGRDLHRNPRPPADQAAATTTNESDN